MIRSWRFLIVAACVSTALCQERLSDPAAEVRVFNLRLAGGHGICSNLERRAESLSRLIRSNPSEALALALSPAQARRALRDCATARRWIETRGHWEGPVAVVTEDDFSLAASRTRVWMTIDGRRVEVHSTNVLSGLISGATLQTIGILLDSQMAATTEIRGPGVSCYPKGELRTAVLTFDFPGLPFSASGLSIADLREAYFSKTQVSVDAYIREVSGGQSWLTGDVFGPIQYNGSSDVYYYFSQLADMIAAADKVVDFRDYNRIAIVWQVPLAAMGPGSTTPYWNGRGWEGCCQDLVSPSKGYLTGSVSWVFGMGRNWNNLIFVAAHEMGHNLGLSHASTMSFGSTPLGGPGAHARISEAGDPYSIMGGNPEQGDTSVLWRSMGQIAAAQKYHLGWLDDRTVTHVEAGGTFHLDPYELAGSGVKALHVRRMPGSDEWLWIEYRQPSGFDKALASGSTQIFQGALIRYSDPACAAIMAGPQCAHLLDFTAAETPDDFSDPALATGRSWSDPYGPLTIRVDTADANGLDVTISYDTGCVVLPAAATVLGAQAVTGSFSVVAPSGCAWRAASDATWLKITGAATGSGSGTVSYAVAANTDAAARHAIILVGWQRFVVAQQGSTGSSNEPPDPVVMVPYGGTGTSQTFTITASDPNGADDIKLVLLQLNHAGDVHYSCKVMAMKMGASGMFMLLDPDTWAYVNLSPPFPSQVAYPSRYCWLDGSTLQFGPLSSDTMLLRLRLLFPREAMGDWYVNLYSQDRGDLSSGITGGSGWQVPATDCTYSIDPGSMTLGAAADSRSVTVTAGTGCEWLAATSVPWITVTGFKGSGNGVVTFRVNANTGTSARTGTINIFGQTFTVTQAGN